MVLVRMVAVSMSVRTRRRNNHSAAWLAVVAAAHLPQHDAAPEVAREFADLLWQRHRLIEIGQERAKRASVRHVVLLSRVAGPSPLRHTTGGIALPAVSHMSPGPVDSSRHLRP